MKVLNRPMFRIGGPIKEGIMHGIKEPRQRYQDAGQVFKNVENLLCCEANNVDFYGMIFYKKSSRNISIDWTTITWKGIEWISLSLWNLRKEG